MFCVILVIYIMTHARISCDRKLLLENRTKQHAILLSGRSAVRIRSGTPKRAASVLCMPPAAFPKLSRIERPHLAGRSGVRITSGTPKPLPQAVFPRFAALFFLTPVKFEGIERSEIFGGLVFMHLSVHILLIGFERFLKVC